MIEDEAHLGGSAGQDTREDAAFDEMCSLHESVGSRYIAPTCTCRPLCGDDHAVGQLVFKYMVHGIVV